MNKFIALPHDCDVTEAQDYLKANARYSAAVFFSYAIVRKWDIF